MSNSQESCTELFRRCARKAEIVASITDSAVTRYVDITAAAGSSFTYKLVTVTDSPTTPSNPSNEVTVTTPADGQASAVFQPDVAGARPAGPPPEPTGESCPECSKPLVTRKGRYGPFVSCSGYPACKYRPPKTALV